MRNSLTFPAFLLCLSSLLAGCSSDLNTPAAVNDEATGQGDGNPAPVPAGNGDFTLRVDADSLALIEGGDAASIGISVQHGAGHTGSVVLSVEPVSSADGAHLDWQFADAVIDAGESSSTLSVRLAIGVRPLLPQQREVRIVGDDGSGVPVSATLMLDVTPTDRPDIYLLAGQSNMVGYSEAGARQAGPGEPDAPDPRILQLNVTGNDPQNFATAADFADPAHVAVPSPRYTPALDPLHDGYGGENGKSGTFIGPGLSFARQALADTTADIVLVPAAWSDTGFCKRTTNIVPGIGWNATAKANEALSGTLLFERAVLRASLAIEETGGILRGILWHQGEADSDDVECAITYEANLRELVAALRTEIAADARGTAYRGPAAPIPFIAGTMSKGGAYAPFGNLKLIVDGAHRTIADGIDYADYVNNDDLVPPDYPCGEGSCIHFGSAAYREMGHRYYRQLLGVLDRQ